MMWSDTGYRLRAPDFSLCGRPLLCPQRSICICLTQVPGACPDSCWPEPPTQPWTPANLPVCCARVKCGYIWPFPNMTLGIQTESDSKIQLGRIQTYKIVTTSKWFLITHGLWLNSWGSLSLCQIPKANLGWIERELAQLSGNSVQPAVESPYLALGSVPWQTRNTKWP